MTRPAASSSATPNWRGSGTLVSMIWAVRPTRAELVHQRGDAANDEVVTEIHDEVVVTQVVTGHEHCVRQAERRLLADVGDIKAEVRAVAYRLTDRGCGFPDHDPDVADADVPDRLKAVEEDRLVGHRQKLLGRRMCDRAQPGAGAARQDQCLHR